MTAFEKKGLRILFTFEKQDSTLFIHLQASNSTSSPITNFTFKAAVPKVTDPSFSLEIWIEDDLFLF